MSLAGVTVSRMDVGVIVYCAGLEAPAMRETARRILEAEAARLGVALGRAEVLQRRARGGPPVHVMAWLRQTSWCGTWQPPRRIRLARRLRRGPCRERTAGIARTRGCSA